MSKKILFLVRSAPYAGAAAYETLEALLVAAVFEQELAVLFADDGVYQLVRNQDPAPLGVRSLGAGLKALPTYDVERVYVAADALTRRALSIDDLEIPVTLLNPDAVAELIAGQEAVISG